MTQKLVGDVIRTRRVRLGLPQEKVATAVGTTQQTVDRIERGETQFSRYLQPISEFLDAAERENDVHQNREGPHPTLNVVPLFYWRSGTIEREIGTITAPPRLGSGDGGYGLRLGSVVTGPNGDAVFFPGDTLFVSASETPRNYTWSVIVDKEDAKKVRISMYVDPDLMPPQIPRSQFVDWGFALAEDDTVSAQPILAYYAA